VAYLERLLAIDVIIQQRQILRVVRFIFR